MNRKLKCTLSLVMVAIIAVSFIAGLNFGAVAESTPHAAQLGELSVQALTDIQNETPTDAPTSAPTDTQTDMPTMAPTDDPTDNQPNVPIVVPSEVPTDAPTDAPIEVPTDAPTDAPTEVPTDAPTEVPTDTPTDVPTDEPTDVPTDVPTDAPTQVESLDAVQNFRKVSTLSDEIQLTWDAVKGAKGYVLYYRNSDQSDDFVKLTTTSTTYLYIKGLDHTTPFQFKISAYAVNDNAVVYGDTTYLETATNPAAMPAPSIKRSSTLISFSWNKNLRADGYIIYRASSKTNGKMEVYKTINDTNVNTFEDTNVEQGKCYNYMVKSYYTPYNGMTFYSTGEKLRTLAGLSAPGKNNFTTQLRRASIVWNKNKYAQGYYIYYSTSESGPFTLLKDTTNTWFNTPRLVNNQKYYFRVVPYRVVDGNTITGTWLALNTTITDKAYGKTIGNTYIEISLQQQRMWFYIDGELYVETPVVTGNYGTNDTPKGAHTIWQRSKNVTLVGPTWSSPVTYWLAFTYSGCGIHDASWRSNSEYGGTTYKGNGSHGCVNTPYDAVKKIYEKAKIGGYVVVY